MKRLNEKPIGRWAINIDLEGFGHLYDKEEIKGFEKSEFRGDAGN